VDSETKKNIARFYDIFSAEYSEKYFHELDRKPFDREILDTLSEIVGPDGLICDVGCGPGEIAVHLHSRGCTVVGIDISEEMIREAKRLSPDIQFEVGDMTRMRFGDNFFDAITAFYAIVHCTYDDARDAFREFYRVLCDGGVLLLAFHIGDEVIHLEKGASEVVGVDFRFLDPERISRELAEVGFTVEDIKIRSPYPGVEYQSRRAYIRARKKVQ
jgi:ubiquinone/menaquinone biosynthesis C-methylase UbiE